MTQLAVSTALPPPLVGAGPSNGDAQLGAEPGRSRRGLLPHWLAQLLGVAAVIAAWEVLAVFVFAGKHVMPTPLGLVAGLWDNRTLLWENSGVTLSEAGQGWLWGNGLAIGLALVFMVSTAVEGALLRLAIASYCMPIIAIAPILNIVFNGDQPKVVLAALSVFFTTLVGMSAGLRAADHASLEVVHAFGGTSLSALVKVRLRASLPSLFAALRIAAPASLLGALIGEYLGGTSGLGVAMINAEQSLDVTRVWSLALFAAALAGAGYVVTGAVARRLTPWAASAGAAAGQAPPGTAPLSLMMRATRSSAFLVASVLIGLGCWLGFIKVFGLNPYFAKSPGDVWDFVAQGPGAAANRSQLWQALATTLRDASLGYAAGTVLAVIVAMAVTSYRAVESAFMPTAIVLRSVPLVAMTPLIALVFGRGLMGVTVIAGMVTFFPTLVNVVGGLRSAPHDSVLLLRAYNASTWATLLKLRLPSALPSLFSSARIAVPGALLGATGQDRLVDELAGGPIDEAQVGNVRAGQTGQAGGEKLHKRLAQQPLRQADPEGGGQ